MEHFTNMVIQVIVSKRLEMTWAVKLGMIISDLYISYLTMHSTRMLDSFGLLIDESEKGGLIQFLNFSTVIPWFCD